VEEENMENKEQWTEPTVADFEVSELTREFDGTDIDSQDPQPAAS
jgi:hypothetical protein